MGMSVGSGVGDGVGSGVGVGIGVEVDIGDGAAQLSASPKAIINTAR